MCTIIRDKKVRVRKIQTCHGCALRIPNGKVVRAQTSRGDGSIYTLYLCDECQERTKDWGKPILFGDLIQ